MSTQPDTIETALELFIEQRRSDPGLRPHAFVARHAAFGRELLEALEALIALDAVTDWDSAHPGVPECPELIGPYRIVREIGRGGMGVVYEAREEPLGRRVALKVLPPESLASPSARARFRREAQVVSRLDHSGIATLYAAGVELDQPWIAMRFVEGRTLAEAIADAREQDRECAVLHGGAPRGHAAVIALAACTARVARTLQFAHSQGVVHRDVKPSNILIGDDEAPVLLDFGLAIGEEGDAATLTRTGHTAGTPAYLAPEVVSGERARPDAQSDVYALGVTLYECLALRRPFDAATPVALYRAIESGAASDVRSLNRDVPRDLAVIVATAMQRDPARRYACAGAFADDLEACVVGRPIRARPVPLAGKLLRWARREPRQAVLAGLLAGATVGAAVLAGIWLEGRAEVRAAADLSSARSLENALSDGFASLGAGEIPEADREFARALAIEPGHPEAIAGQALVRLRQERTGEAIALLDAGPKSPAFRALRAYLADETTPAEHPADWFASASAVEMFIDGLRLDEEIDRSPLHERKRLAKLALERYDQAIDRSRTARLNYHSGRVIAAKDAGDERATRAAAASLRVLWPNNEAALLSAGFALYDIDPAAAIPVLESAIAIGKRGRGGPHMALGLARKALGDLEGAEQDMRRAIERNPRDVQAHNALGNLLRDRGCFDEAREVLVRALRVQPIFETWGYLGLLDIQREDDVAAEQELRMALAYRPRDWLALHSHAGLLLRRGDAEEALTEVQAALGFHPEHTGTWVLLADCHAALGEHEAALAAAEGGLERWPGDPELEGRLAAAQFALELER